MFWKCELPIFFNSFVSFITSNLFFWCSSSILLKFHFITVNIFPYLVCILLSLQPCVASTTFFVFISLSHVNQNQYYFSVKTLLEQQLFVIYTLSNLAPAHLKCFDIRFSIQLIYIYIWVEYLSCSNFYRCYMKCFGDKTADCVWSLKSAVFLCGWLVVIRNRWFGF